jgi:hypothetical protein
LGGRRCRRRRARRVRGPARLGRVELGEWVGVVGCVGGGGVPVACGVGPHKVAGCDLVEVDGGVLFEAVLASAQGAEVAG